MQIIWRRPCFYRSLPFDSNNLLVNLDPYYHKQDTNHVEKKNKTQISKYWNLKEAIGANPFPILMIMFHANTVFFYRQKKNIFCLFADLETNQRMATRESMILKNRARNSEPK
jgi:hypothetical protein